MKEILLRSVAQFPVQFTKKCFEFACKEAKTIHSAVKRLAVIDIRITNAI
jgi:hypothetical protein